MLEMNNQPFDKVVDGARGADHVYSHARRSRVQYL